MLRLPQDLLHQPLVAQQTGQGDDEGRDADVGHQQPLRGTHYDSDGQDDQACEPAGDPREHEHP